MEARTLPIEQVAENPANPRRKLGDITSLAKSIATLGLIQPIAVHQVDEAHFVVVAGARRFAACKQLAMETIDCVVFDGPNNEALAAIAENTSREDLSVDDLSDAVSRLDGLEMTDVEISAALAITEKDVASARVVSKAPKKVKTAIKALAPENRQFTLEESAAMVKYGNSPERLDDIAYTLSDKPEQLPHLLARFDEEDATEALIKELKASVKGCIEIKPFSKWERPVAGAEPLHNLTTGDGKKLTAVGHKNCPNRAYLLVIPGHWEKGKPHIVDYCADWESSGHKLSDKPKQPWPRTREVAAKNPVTDKEREKKTAERRKVIANNKAWATATKVRETWLDEFALRTEINQAAKQWVLNEIILDPSEIAKTQFKGSIRGFEQSFVVVFGQLVKAREDLLKTHSWRPSSFARPMLERYMTMLKSQGYPVSDVESLLVKEKSEAAHDAA
jgi:ParB family chromosome partitioning protein